MSYFIRLVVELPKYEQSLVDYRSSMTVLRSNVISGEGLSVVLPDGTTIEAMLLRVEGTEGSRP